MSWNVSYNSKSNFRGDFRDPSSTHEDLIPKDQISIARQVVNEIIISQAVGIGKDYTINISGHGNPEHEPVEGMSNDWLSVTINQK